MILCVTLNPCLDKTLTVPAWKPGDNVRGSALRAVVGGKGNNVARALTRLGRTARPVTFLGGAVGAQCEAMLRDADKLEPIVVPSQAETRVILTVRTRDTAEQSAFFDPDPAIRDTEAEALYRAVEEAIRAGGVEVLTLSGSSPCASTDSLYSDLISLARGSRVTVFLDTYGKALEAIWGFWPDVMQMNRREAAGLLGKAPASLTDEDVLALLDEWSRRGVSCGVVTDGPGAVLAVVEARYYRALPPKLEAVNPIGSGDCLLAGLVDGRLEGLAAEPLLKRGVASAVANAATWDAGAVSRDALTAFEPQVTIEPMNRPRPASPPAGLQRHGIRRK